jgi:hypothetical protein
LGYKQTGQDLEQTIRAIAQTLQQTKDPTLKAMLERELVDAYRKYSDIHVPEKDRMGNALEP